MRFLRFFLRFWPEVKFAFFCVFLRLNASWEIFDFEGCNFHEKYVSFVFVLGNLSGIKNKKSVNFGFRVILLQIFTNGFHVAPLILPEKCKFGNSWSDLQGKTLELAFFCVYLRFFAFFAFFCVAFFEGPTCVFRKALLL